MALWRLKHWQLRFQTDFNPKNFDRFSRRLAFINGDKIVILCDTLFSGSSKSAGKCQRGEILLKISPLREGRVYAPRGEYRMQIWVRFQTQ